MTERTPLGNIIIFTVTDRPRVEVKGSNNAIYRVEFIDAKTNKIIYQTQMQRNCWSAANPIDGLSWSVVVYENGVLFFNRTIDVRALNVKLVHLLSNPMDEAEKRSIASLSQVERFGIKYTQNVNGYETRLPAMKPLYPTGQYGQSLKPGHFGCWKAQRRAVEEEFDDDLDFLIICERDVVLTIPPDEFYRKVMRCLKTAASEGVDYISFGYSYSPLTGNLQSPVIGSINDEMYVTNHIIGLHCIAFPRARRDFLLDAFHNIPWYGADIWYNEIFGRNGKKIAIVKDRCVDTDDGGFSIIDGPRDPKVERVLYFSPHCSTGGMPQYMLQCVEKDLAAGKKVEVVEYENIAPPYVVQKNRIKALCPFHTLGENKLEILDIIDRFKPTIVHLQEFPEVWLHGDLAEWLYKRHYGYKIVETTHTSSKIEKEFIPDEFVLVSAYSRSQYIHLGIPITISEYGPRQQAKPDRTESLVGMGLDPAKKHVLNVGLFTPNKNQGQIFRIAKAFPDVFFHFVGNQAMNFTEYWQPLMLDRPDNCIVWGERDDVDKFYAAMDIFLFTSVYELSPIVIKEAVSWSMPVLLYDLPQYSGEYSDMPGVVIIPEQSDECVISELSKVLNTVY